MKNLYRYILGYLIGFSLFILLLPYGFYKLSELDFIFSGRILICCDILRYILASIFLLNGGIFAGWSNLFLFKVGKGGPTDAFGVSISPQSKKLVTTGPYKFSRNPMVFGALSLYAGTIIFLNSITASIAWVILLILVIIFLKKSEEKRLLRDFGEEYLEYKKKVSMIFPLKLKFSKN